MRSPCMPAMCVGVLGRSHPRRCPRGTTHCGREVCDACGRRRRAGGEKVGGLRPASKRLAGTPPQALALSWPARWPQASPLCLRHRQGRAASCHPGSICGACVTVPRYRPAAWPALEQPDSFPDAPRDPLRRVNRGLRWSVHAADHPGGSCKASARRGSRPSGGDCAFHFGQPRVRIASRRLVG
jgi:hypothetical protein